MAIVVQTASVATGTAGANFTGTASPLSATVSPPTGLASGDCWVIVAVAWNGSGAAWNTPTGFTLQSTAWNDGASQNVGVTLWYKPNCTGTETAVTITDTQSAANILFAYATWRMSGSATASPFVDISDGSASTEIAAATASSIVSTAASHTPSFSGEAVFFIAAQGSSGATSAGGITWTTPSGWTLLTVANHDTASGGGAGDAASMAIFFVVQTAATTVPITSSTATFPGNSWAAGATLGAVISFDVAPPADPFPPGYGYLHSLQHNAVYRM